MIDFCRLFEDFFFDSMFLYFEDFFFIIFLYFVEEEDPDFFFGDDGFCQFFLKLIGSLTPAMSRRGRNCLAASSLRILVKEVSGVVDPSIPISCLRGLNSSGSMET